jgi:hypothetical protein
MRKMPTKITIRENGSIRVEGDFTIHDVNGNADPRPRSHRSAAADNLKTSAGDERTADQFKSLFPRTCLAAACTQSLKASSS